MAWCVVVSPAEVDDGGVDIAEEMAMVEAFVTGPYDVVARVEAASIDALGSLVVSKIQAVGGVTRTLTRPVVRL